MGTARVGSAVELGRAVRTVGWAREGHDILFVDPMSDMLRVVSCLVGYILCELDLTQMNRKQS